MTAMDAGMLTFLYPSVILWNFRPSGDNRSIGSSADAGDWRA